MDKTCGNCKYRGREIEGSLNEDYDYGPTGFFLCELIKMVNDDWFKRRGVGAVAKDASGYHAALCVETDFACNRWELRTSDIG